MAVYIELKENLSGSYRQLDSMSEGVLLKLKNISNLLNALRNYSRKASDSFRNDLKEKLFETTLELKEVGETLKIMESIKVSANNKEAKREQIRKLNKSYNKSLKETTKVMEEIEKLEKKSIQNARISLQNKEDQEGAHRNIKQERESQQWVQMDIDEEIIRERENYIVELTKLLTEMNALAKVQGKIISDGWDDIGKIDENIQKTKENTHKTEKELTDANYYKNQLVQSE